MNYCDYFNQTYLSNQVQIDETIEDAIYSDLEFNSQEEELHFLRKARIALIAELLVFFEYLEEHYSFHLYLSHRESSYNDKFKSTEEKMEDAKKMIPYIDNNLIANQLALPVETVNQLEEEMYKFDRKKLLNELVQNALRSRN